MTDTNLRFLAPSSVIEPSFWEELYNKKLNVYKLNSDYQLIYTQFSASDGWKFSKESYDKSNQSLYNSNIGNGGSLVSIAGSLVNVNTVDEFKNIDKKELLNSTALTCWYNIKSGKAICDPTLLFNYVLLSFADLKEYRFTYWFGMPALLPSSPFLTLAQPCLLKDYYDEAETMNIQLTCDKIDKDIVEVGELNDSDESDSDNVKIGNNSIYQSALLAIYNGVCDSSVVSKWPRLPLIFAVKSSISSATSMNEWNIYSLSDVWSTRYEKNTLIVILDIGTSSSYGWAMRNLLTLLSIHAPINVSSSVRIIACRGSLMKKLLIVEPEIAKEMLSSMSNNNIIKNDSSVIFDVDVSSNHFTSDQLDSSIHASMTNLPTVVGWETNERNKPGPRLADLRNVLDSKLVMSQAVDLNLKLMKWRMWPQLDLEKLSNTRCLLFGAGTLGCAVARALLGWGVKHITLVDNGRVSYSNPVRQCLFEFDDCEKRTFKSVAAANALKRIFPGCESRGVVLTIPMPGHPLADSEIIDDAIDNKGIKEDVVSKIDSLIQSHDVCFALTDSREARWLPTMLCARYNKIMINSALGFDSFLVMRHGHGANLDIELDKEDFDNVEDKIENIIEDIEDFKINKIDINTIIDRDIPLDINNDQSFTSMISGVLSEMNNVIKDQPNEEEDVEWKEVSFQPTNSSTSSPSVKTLSEKENENKINKKKIFQRLGCYFCNDIVAATNSQRDRSLDQQCTVTRPGLSFIAAAYCVEIMVALLQSPLEIRHPGPNIGNFNPGSNTTTTNNNNKNNDDDDDDDDLVVIPHQIRGSLASFTQISPMTPNFSFCTACSNNIVNEYQSNGINFVKRVCEDSSVLESISGISELTSNIDLDMCIDSDEDF